MSWRNKIIKECGLSKEIISPLRIKPKVYKILEGLAKEFKNEEFLLFLTGKNGVAEDVYIPKQRRSTAYAELKEELDPEIEKKIVALVHYHHRMGAFSSGTDEEYSLNHKVSLIYDDKLEAVIAYTVILPCGHLYRTKFEKIKLIELVEFEDKVDVSKYVEEIKEKTEKKKLEWYKYPLVDYGYGISMCSECGTHRLTSRCSNCKREICWICSSKHEKECKKKNKIG